MLLGLLEAPSYVCFLLISSFFWFLPQIVKCFWTPILRTHRPACFCWRVQLLINLCRNLSVMPGVFTQEQCRAVRPEEQALLITAFSDKSCLNESSERFMLCLKCWFFIWNLSCLKLFAITRTRTRSKEKYQVCVRRREVLTLKYELFQVSQTFLGCKHP